MTMRTLYMFLQKRLIASQLKPRKSRDIKWILIENIYGLFIQKKTKKTVEPEYCTDSEYFV